MQQKHIIIKFLTAQTITLFGSNLVQFAMIWYVTLHTSSGIMMGVATLCGYLPQIVISLFAGVLLDRYNRKLLLIASDAVIAFSTLLLAFAFMNGYQSMYAVFIVLIIRSLGTGIQTPGVNAIIPQLCEESQLVKVNSMYASVNAVMMFLAPACSGILLSNLGMDVTFFIDVITAMIGNLILFFIPIQKTSNMHRESMRKELKNGFHYVINRNDLKYLMIFALFVMFFISPTAFLTPLFVSRSFGGDVWRLSVSEMLFSLGTVAGGIFMSRYKGHMNYLKTVSVATILYGSMMIGIGCSTHYIIYLLFNFLIGITMPCFNTPFNVYLQESTPQQMHGRIFSLVQIISSASLPMGTALFGPIADSIQIYQVFILAGIIVCCLGFGYYRKITSIPTKS